MSKHRYGLSRTAIKQRIQAMAQIGRLLPFVLAMICLQSIPAMGAGKDQQAIKLMVFGDSLTAGYGLAAKDAFPVQLQRALHDRGHAVTVINAGVSGDTTAGGRARLAWSLSEQPDAIIVELGANDGLRGIDPAETLDNLMAIVATLKQAGVPTLLAGMQAPPNMGRGFGDEFNKIFGIVAGHHGVDLYPFFLDGVAAQQSLNQSDGIHPNATGVGIVVERILPAVERLLASLEK
ncbi:MAG: arylesterase [Rhodospirillaceae bacterium]